MIVREILTKVGFKVDNRPLKEYDQATESAKRRTEAFRKGLNVAVTAAAALGTAAIAAATGVYKLVESVAQVGDQAAKDAKKLGLTAEAVQELNHAANLAGTDFGTMKVGLQALSRGLNDAAEKGTGPAAEAFEQLGISLSDPAIKSKNLEQILALVSDRMAELPDDADKTALSMKLFSRSGAELIPLLNEGSIGIAQMRQEARDLGIVMSNEAAASSEAFNDDVLRLKSSIKGIAVGIGVELMPHVHAFIDGAREWISENDQLIKQDIPDLIRLGADAMRDFVPQVLDAVTSVRDLVRWFQMMREEFPLFEAVVQNLGNVFDHLGLPFRLVKDMIVATVDAILQLAEKIPGLEKSIRSLRVAVGLKAGPQGLSGETERELESDRESFKRQNAAEAKGRKVIGGLDLPQLPTKARDPSGSPRRTGGGSGRRSRGRATGSARTSVGRSDPGGLPEWLEENLRSAAPSARSGLGSESAARIGSAGDGPRLAIPRGDVSPQLGATINHINFAPSSTFTVEVTQRPGEDGHGLAERVTKEARKLIDENEKRWNKNVIAAFSGSTR